MPGPPPNPTRRRRNKPARGDWQATPGIGWQHAEIPSPPDGLLAATRLAWETWFKAWFAAHWTPADLPGLRKVAQLYDATERGEMQRSAELRMSMDGYGITPKGQQVLRWAPPKDDEKPKQAAAQGGHYQHLRVVNE